jgi:hypothetical protein
MDEMFVLGFILGGSAGFSTSVLFVYFMNERIRNLDRW